MVGTVDGEIKYNRKTSKRSFELLIMLVFILPITLVSSPDSNKIEIFSIVYSTARLMWIILLVYTFILIIDSGVGSSRLKLDKVALLLLLRIPLSFIPFFYTNMGKDYINYLSAMVASLIAYVVFKNIVSNNYKKFLNTYTFLLILILFLQLIFTIINLRKKLDIFNVSNLGLYVKNYLVVPIGASNYIAAFLLVGFTISFVQLTRNKQIDKSIIVINMVSLIGIFLTFSRGAILGIIIVVFIEFITNKRKRFTSKVSNIIVLLVLMFIVVIVLNQLLNIDIWNSIVGKTLEESNMGFNTMMSGRIEIYAQALKRFISHPVFGSGWTINRINYNNQSFRAHNIFLELLSQSGLIGIIIYSIIIMTVINKLKKCAEMDIITRSVLFVVFATLAHGMIEPNLFGFQYDFFFWSIIGIGMSRVDYISKLNKDT